MPACVASEVALLFASFVDDAAVYALQSTGLLSSTVRRNVLVTLLQTDTIHRKELAQRLAAAETVPQSDPEHIELVLHHHHLPRLADEQFIDYDARNGDIVLWKDPETAAALLESA